MSSLSCARDNLEPHVSNTRGDTNHSRHIPNWPRALVVYCKLAKHENCTNQALIIMLPCAILHNCLVDYTFCPVALAWLVPHIAQPYWPIQTYPHAQGLNSCTSSQLNVPSCTSLRNNLVSKATQASKLPFSESNGQISRSHLLDYYNYYTYFFTLPLPPTTLFLPTHTLHWHITPQC